MATKKDKLMATKRRTKKRGSKKKQNLGAYSPGTRKEAEVKSLKMVRAAIVELGEHLQKAEKTFSVQDRVQHCTRASGTLMDIAEHSAGAKAKTPASADELWQETGKAEQRFINVCLKK